MIADTILANLIYNEDYCRQVFPYIEPEYFETDAHKKIFDSVSSYINDYKSLPSIETLKILLESRNDLNEKTFAEIKTAVKNLKPDPLINNEWLVKETEKYCQDQAFSNALKRCIAIYNGAEKDVDMGAAPIIMSDALSVSFDTNIGHDFFENIEERFEFYHRKEERIPFDLDFFNLVTKGGLPRKSLTVYMAETGAGKSLVMCHQAASALMHGFNVLYISMELAEERVSERIDANILDLELDVLKTLDKEVYVKRMKRLAGKTKGKLVVKEYPTGAAHSGHFRNLLNELKLKKKFVPDIIFIDYLNICASSRIKGANAANSYTLVKSIAEEIRGLAMEFGVPIVSATQANRSGYGNSDVDLTNTSESMGLPHTVDAMFALITSEELQEMGHLMVKQLKNRWGDISTHKRFVVGIERAKMKLYNLEESAQKRYVADAKLEKMTREKNDDDEYDYKSGKSTKNYKNKINDFFGEE